MHSRLSVKEGGGGEGGQRRGRRGVFVACRAIPTQGDRSRTSGGQSQSRHSLPRPRAGDRLRSKPGDSLEGHRKGSPEKGQGRDRLASQGEAPLTRRGSVPRALSGKSVDRAYTLLTGPPQSRRLIPGLPLRPPSPTLENKEPAPAQPCLVRCDSEGSPLASWDRDVCTQTWVMDITASSRDHCGFP